jgi:hypothetical protein
MRPQNITIVNKLLFTIPLAILLIPFASAEKITVDVPFDSHGFGCVLNDTVDELTYTCIFEGNVQTLTEEELMKFESILTQEQIDEAIKDINDQKLEEIKLEQSKLTPNEQKIIRLQEKYNKGMLDNDGIEYLRLLKALDQCEQGLGKSRQIQEYRSFDISTELTDFGRNHDFRNQFGVLVKTIEECKGQTILENFTLSEQYNHIIGSEVLQRHHSDGLKGIQAVPFDKLRETNRNVDLNAICNDFRITDSHKEQLGCVIQYDGKSLREWEMENEKQFGNDGSMTIESEILRNYWDFRDTQNFRD